ncbi:heterokaryon incompatibility protein-domain-containing protein [Parachaetomium inaequale]|uniref:Heterokaryon incompatibility protein-domain-containing protein n=1 Tax=Parachaetomium inaequale TaxID=2588326 RepID=A0AAN6P8C9_9PEZI|nr:heterokaryon incompatibility protein-domain-containing protein [Parachaetomium inaequale]
MTAMNLRRCWGPRAVRTRQLNKFRCISTSRHFATSPGSDIPNGPRKPESSSKSSIPGLIGLFLACITLYGGYHLSSPVRQSAKQATERFKRWRALANSPDYDALGPGEIRLLIISPGQPSDPVSCRLERVSLEDNPGFEALSYVWGKDGNTRKITCSGKRCLVTPNLHDALRNFRLPDRERVLWADALCIDQNSPREKGLQIPLMGSIYEKAAQVVIWLGEPTELSGDALPTVRQLNEYLEARLWGYSGSNAPSTRRFFLRQVLPSTAALTPQQAAEIEKINWPAINALLSHAWFRRVWVYQEFAIASKATVFVGRDSMPLEHLLHPFAEIFQQPLVRRMSRLNGTALSSVNGLGRFVIDGGAAGGRSSSRKLLDLVADGCNRDATNARDRIYGFRSLAHDVKPGDWEVTPDYTASVEEVYLRFARWCLLRKGDLDILRFCNHDRKPIRRLPSWVPDWRFSILMRATLNGSNASPGSEPWVSWRPDEPSLLQIKGVIVDRIEQVSAARVQLMLLDSFEHRTGLKFGSAKAAKYLKRHDAEVARHDAQVARTGEDVGSEVSSPEELTALFEEAAAARQRFGSSSTAIPKHEVVNIVWMENCKHIASGGTGKLSEDRLDLFWRTMMSQGNAASQSSKVAFVSYMRILDEVRLGKRTTTRLPGLSPLHDWLAERHGSRRPAQAVQQLRAGVGNRSPQHFEDDRLRAEMHNHWGLVANTRFCFTQKSRLGWVPRSAKPGDVVCVFDGGEVPFVLRPKKEEQPAPSVFRRLQRYLPAMARPAEPTPSAELSLPTRYELVGHCYIQGIMDAEWDGTRTRRAKRQVLELC